MDTKKKRNKKKKGNQGKNTGDATSSAGEAAVQHHNHESAPADHQNGADADDAMSSVGEVVPQHQNHEPTPLIDSYGANAHDTTSSFGEAVACHQNNEPSMTQKNHKVNSAIPADQRSIGMSESSVELDMHKLNDAKLDKLHETIKHLEDEKNLWLQKVSILESELEKLHNKVSYHSRNEILLEEKLNSLQNGYDLLLKKEEALSNKVRRIEDINDTLTHQEASFKERLNGLEETNKALQLQVKLLEETSNNTAEENQRLVKNLNELDSRVQLLEAKAALGEVSTLEKVMDQKDLAGPLLHQQTRDFTEGNKMIADPCLESSLTIISDNNYSQINNSPSNAYAGNRLEETSLQHMEKASINSTAEGLIDLNERQFDKSRTSEEIMPVPLDDIQIHEDGVQQSGADDEPTEVPFSDAPIIGAPFRLISFVARYVSGADLVGEK
ncbi:hypothetical protein PR202_ga25840 [Eleusine coracana subsp. coracana]|uniref:Uncharacterized protein n=1 Tax=Eleusine coracana subsp. coracana TaxID=191504 RepID=A0AAV5DCD9_ELECO|nr:hypothetical protein PR202_ga25840 [Eleusine coracana subsp. coracana]